MINQRACHNHKQYPVIQFCTNQLCKQNSRFLCGLCLKENIHNTDPNFNKDNLFDQVKFTEYIQDQVEQDIIQKKIQILIMNKLIEKMQQSIQFLQSAANPKNKPDINYSNIFLNQEEQLYYISQNNQKKLNLQQIDSILLEIELLKNDFNVAKENINIADLSQLFIKQRVQPKMRTSVYEPKTIKKSESNQDLSRKINSSAPKIKVEQKPKASFMTNFDHDPKSKKQSEQPPNRGSSGKRQVKQDSFFTADKSKEVKDKDKTAKALSKSSIQFVKQDRNAKKQLTLVPEQNIMGYPKYLSQSQLIDELKNEITDILKEEPIQNTESTERIYVIQNQPSEQQEIESQQEDTESPSYQLTLSQRKKKPDFRDSLLDDPNDEDFQLETQIVRYLWKKPVEEQEQEKKNLFYKKNQNFWENTKYIELNSNPKAICVTSDSKYIATALNETIQVWNTAYRQIYQQFHYQQVNLLNFTDDCQHLIIGTLSNEIIIIDFNIKFAIKYQFKFDNFIYSVKSFQRTIIVAQPYIISLGDYTKQKSSFIQIGCQSSSFDYSEKHKLLVATDSQIKVWQNYQQIIDHKSLEPTELVKLSNDKYIFAAGKCKLFKYALGYKLELLTITLFENNIFYINLIGQDNLMVQEENNLVILDQEDLDEIQSYKCQFYGCHIDQQIQNMIVSQFSENELILIYIDL
ncbi:hypothetical protein pb186bvf_019410 [Paramecium bursaria]